MTGDSIFFSQNILDANVVGKVIGYVANCVDAHDLIGSAIRNSFFLTFIWVPIAAACAVGMASSDYRSKSCFVSSARGLTAMCGVMPKFMACSLVVGFGYAAMCTVVFIAGALRYGAAVDATALVRFAGCVALNVLLLMSVIAQSLALYHVTRNSFVAIVGVIILFFYVSTISWFDMGLQTISAGWVMMTPAPYFLVSCSLAYGQMSVFVIAVYAVASMLVALVIGVVAYKIRGK